MPVTSRGVSMPRLFGINQTVEAVFQADHGHAGVVCRLHDSADDGVQAGSVAAAGQHANFFDGRHSKTRDGWRWRMPLLRYGTAFVQR